MHSRQDPAVGSAYAFQTGTFFNLETSDFIKAHGDIAGKEVARDSTRDRASADAEMEEL